MNVRQLRYRLGKRQLARCRTRDSPSAGMVCACCGKIHGRTSGGIFGQWHKCRKCRAIYCDWCGDMLWRPGWFIGRERTCGVQGCGGRTQLFS